MKSIKMKELLIKFIKRECSEKEVDQIVIYFKKSKDLSDFPTVEDISKSLDMYPDMDENAANTIYNNILEVTKSKQIPTKKKFPIWKYAAAAIFIGLLTTTYFIKENIFNTPVEPSLTKVNNEIEPGTEKAILTLDDGSVVILEKGRTYQTLRANSNGEQLVYEVKNTNSKDIAYNYLTIPRGGQFFIKLSDGTQVWLNSESQLKYPTSFIEGEPRQVELVYGEAYFDVSPSTDHNGSKFRVFNQSQEIEVLGTEFNIKAYKDERTVYTTLVEGKVVIDNGNSKFDLVPNQQSNLDLENNNLTITEVDVNAVVSWKNGIFSFKGMPLKDIMKVISRWYDIDVIFENKRLESIKFKGSLDKQQSIEEILSIMKSSSINDYEIKNKTIILK
tara:strand:- start:13557 stop:14723 length:1167 start_codon:yes stop_codon:yes gene_type:complete